MSIYKRGDVYWYKFMWKGQVIRESNDLPVNVDRLGAHNSTARITEAGYCAVVPKEDVLAAATRSAETSHLPSVVDGQGGGQQHMGVRRNQVVKILHAILVAPHKSASAD